MGMPSRALQVLTMPLTSWLRAIYSKLRILGKPLPLASTVGALLLGVFVWEYVRHPEWFGAYVEDATTPGDETALSDLTPEERAAVTDIDNLAVLLNELGIESGTLSQPQEPSDILEAARADQEAGLPDAIALGQPTQTAGLSENSPFRQYLEQYQFTPRALDANLQGSSSNPFQAGAIGSQTSQERTLNRNSLLSPLSFALQNPNGSANRASAQGFTGDTEPSTSALDDEIRAGRAEESADETSEGETSSRTTLPDGEFSSQAVTIPGVLFPFLPTTPAMSPPPGTTGYTPPSTLELMPAIPGQNNRAPGTSATIPAATGVPNLAPATRTAVPNLNAPNVDVSNGYVTPYTPVVPVQPVPSANTTSPFTVPRPPGSYIGGGYINTFSNPTGSPVSE